MKRRIREGFLFTILFFAFYLGNTSGLLAQIKDTTLYDYTNYNGCSICNGASYSCFTYDQQSLANSNSGRKIKRITVKIYHTACGYGDFYAVLNGDTLGKISPAYSCSCYSCTYDSIVADYTKLNNYVYNSTNNIEFKGIQLCVDRIEVIREFGSSSFNDAGIMSLDSPYFSCPGTRSIAVTIANFGKNKIDSVEVHWTYNGISQTTYKHKSTLDTSGGSGSIKARITIGSKTLTVNKRDTIIVWTAMPNGVSDTTNANDTIKKFIQPSYGDTITVGGTNPNFSTIQGAINALQSSGICKSVIVNIRPGSYNEQLSIGKINGTDSLHTVTFRSSTGDSSAVSIYYSSTTSTDNYTLLLNNAQDIIFRQLSLQATNTSYGKVIEIRGNFLRLAFKNCLIIGVSNSSTSSYNALVSHGTINSGINRGLTFEKSEFKYGSMGIYWSTSTTAKGLSIVNCKFSDQYFYNIYAYYINNITIDRNDISRPTSAYNSGYGVYLESNQSVTITNNKIIQPSGGYGLYTYSIQGTSNQRNLIANNFISVGKSDYINAYAWMCYYATYTDFFNNSTYSNSIYSNYPNLYIYYGSNIRVRNNSILQEAPGQIIYVYYNGTRNLEKLDNNNYFSKASSSSFYLNGTNYNTFANWQTAIGLDSFSTYGNPNYKSTSDLHAYATDLNGRAKPDARITTDIDGQSRNSSTPDIGADEFNLVPVDAGVSNILPYKADSICVQAVLKNNGNDTLKTVQLGWSINGATKTAYSWSGTLLSGQSATVCVGKFKFTGSTNYTVKAWTSQPNSKTDTMNFNDTFTRTGKPAMSGTYTIGGTTPDFSTFNAAVSEMVSRGIIDSVKFKVRNGTYSERVEIPKITGANSLNTIIFESENKNSSLVTLSYATNYSYYDVVYLNGSNGVSFRQITIKSTSTTPSRAVTLANGASNIELYRNRLESGATSSTDYSYNSVIYADNAGTNIRIIDNTILNGATAIYLRQNVGITIRGNSMENAYYFGIYANNGTNLDFSNNTIKSNSSYSGYYGTYFYYLYGTNTISGNRIFGPNKAETYGLYIQNLYISNSTDSNYIFNNFISAGGTNCQRALYLETIQNTYFVHNNVYFYGTRSGSNYAGYFYNTNNSKIYNNNFVCTGSGFPIAINYPYGAINDYNNYYTSGSYLAQLNYSSYSSLASLKANALDSHSVNLNPNFISATDLHVQNVLLDKTAKKLHFASKDIDQELRDSFKPDIGADEFVPAQRDAGVVAFLSPANIIKADTTLIKVVVRNLGLGTLYSFKVKCKINADTFPVVSYNDTLLSGDSVHIVIGKYKFKRDSINNLAAWTTLPNGTNDQKLSNDTFRLLNKRTAMSGVYTIGGSSPDFTGFKEALKAMYLSGISGGVRFRVRAGTYTEQLRILPIEGAGAINSVIFESSTLDSSSVILQYSASYSDTNYVVFFNGSSGITFRNMTIKALGTSYSVVFLYENKAQYNILNNNYIKGYVAGSTSNSNAVIASFNGTYSDEFNEFNNNLIEGGSYGMYWYGYGSNNPNTYENGSKIRNNYFKNQYYMGLYLYYQMNTQIDKNIINSTSTYSNYYSIYGYYSYNKLRITSNNITNNSNYGYGMYFYNCSGNGSDTILIANNFINLNSNYYPQGIHMEYPYYTHIVNNTIRHSSSTTSSAFGIYLYSGNYNQILNNIVENAGQGYCLYVQYPSSITRSDYNNFRTAGTNLAYWNGSNYGTLAALQAVSQKDSHTLVLDPQFISSSDLHVKQIGFNGKATPHPLVKTDIDGQLRNTTKPDIGADEFNPPAIDASLVEFFSPKDAIKADTTRITVVVRNMGTSALSSYMVKCKINRDTFATVVVSKSLGSGDTAHITVGSYLFKRDSTNNLTAWTFNPNGTSDQNTTNDTFRVINKKTAMSGIYTIGGSSPDFPNFKSAIKAMNNVGILDYVRFRVRSGTYTEQLKLIPISGAGALNSVIFESENLDSTSVTLQYNSVYYDSNYVVYFNGASGITFRKMRIRALNSTYSTVFLYENKAQYNILNNNYIIGNGINSTSSYNAVIGSFNSTYADDYNQFNNNLIEGGSFGLYWYGSGGTTGYENKTIIRNNRFKDQYYMGLYLQYQTNAEIDRNTFTSASPYTYYYSVYGYYLNNKLRITANHIKMSNTGGYGIYMQNSNGYGDTVLVANNMVQVGGTNSDYGIYFYGSNYVHIINNTVKMAASTSNSAVGIYLYSGNYNHILNNIIENSGAGYCMDIPIPSSVTNSDRNNFRTKGSNLIRWNGNNYTGLSSFKAATQKDSHSLVLDPLFISADNLHIREIGLNGKASRHPLVKIDIDGQVRNSTSPDIGADEFNPPALDAGISDIITPKTPFFRDSQFVAVVLKNFGLNNISSVSINWQLNGASQSTYSWSGNLSSNDTVHVRLAKKFFDRDSAYSMKTWTSLPNSYNDTVNYNDTAVTINQYPALSGVYTIGGASPDFNTFTDAIDAMKRGGIINQVTFNVRNGSYSEKLNITKIVGASKRNSIIFQSENLDSTKVTLINSYNTPGYNYTLWLQGAVGITFKHMTISATNSSYGIVAYLTEGASLNTFTNLVMEGVSTTSTSTDMAVVQLYSTNNFNNYNNHFTNNIFRNGSYGLYSYGYANGFYDKNLLIKNNIIETPYYTGIYLVYNDTANISGNKITVGNSTNAFGIRMEYCNSSYRIIGNSVVVPNGYMGIYLYGCSGLSTKFSLISNNMVSLLGNGNYYGIYGYSTSYINLYNNNFHVNSNTSNSYAAMIYGSSIRSVNNIFDHTGAGYAFYNNSSSFTESNYNCYRSNGSNLAYWNGDRTNLSALRAANSTDNKSISVDPTFVSETDLHVRAIDLDKAGKPLADVKFDIDGTKRDSLLPDIGADEFKIPSPNDAGISAFAGPLPPFSPGSNTVKVILNNYGSDTLKSATIHWTMNGVTQSNYSWTGAIKTGASATINIGTYSFSNGVNYTLVAWPVSPNGASDTIHYNDTLKKINIYSALAGKYTIGGYLPDFKTFAEANLALMQRGVRDTVLFNVRNGTYEEQLEILPYPGSDANRPVTFASESGDSTKVILQFNNPVNYFLIHLKGADNISFSRMTLRSYGSYYYNNVVQIDNEAKNSSLINNRIISEQSYYHYYGYYGSGVLSGSDKDDNLKVLNNYISGDIGIQILGGGAATNLQETGVVVEGNKIDRFYSYGIRCTYMNAPIVRKNNLTPDANTGGYLIYLSDVSNDLIVSHNKLHGTDNSSYGILVSNHVGTSAKKGNIFNNFVSIPNPYYYGIYLNNTSYCNVYYNSVNLFGNQVNSTSSALMLANAVNMEVKNNILCNNAGGFAINCDAVPGLSNYNDLYTSGTNLGRVNSTDYSSFTAWKSGTSRDANSKSVDPTFFSNTDLHTTLVNLDSAAKPVTGITNDIDFNTRNTTHPDIGADEFNSLPNNLSITTILNPVSGCLIDSQQLRVTIFNYGSLMQKNFPVRYKINGGTIYSQTFTDSIFPGTSKTFSFSGKVNTKPTNNYNFYVWTDLSTDQYRLNDTIKSVIINYAIPDSVKTMTPVDSIKNLAFPISLSWAPANGATIYDVYIWPDNASRPSTPAYYGLSQIGVQIPNGLSYGATYNWQIFARNPSCATFGKVQKFTVRELPDLLVSSVGTPSTAFSGTNISVSWVVKNAGKGTTGTNGWYDLLYLSNDLILDALDPVLTGVVNATSLTPNQSYNTSTTVTLPDGIIGKYYILVKTEAYNYFLESNEGNNISNDTTGMAVSLTPPPDLQVISVIKPGTAFSGQTINMQYTVKNKGTGITRSNAWTDYIYLNKDSATGGTFMRSISHSGALAVDSIYKVNTTITLPFNISGGYYIIVKTDGANNVFEHAAENNNERISDSMKVIQTPPPDLIVRNIRLKDSISNKEVVNLTYDLINQGGSVTTTSWIDNVYISKFSTFNAGTATLLAQYSRGNIQGDDTLVASQNITIPDNLNGLFYMYIATDYYNNQYEGTKDTNNLSARKSFRILTPDLVVSSVNIPSSDSSGKLVKVDWVVKNNGVGKNIYGLRQDKIYISRYSNYHKDSVKLIDSVEYNVSINPNDSIMKSHYSRIPNGTYGSRYFYVITDVLNHIYENGKDTNNYRRSNKINVILSPYPDLRAISVNVPDSSEAGKTVNVAYVVDNKGNKNAIPQWKDKVFISKDSVFNVNKIVLLQTNTLKSTLMIDSSYGFNQTLQLPNTISAGNYYFFVYTDASDALYEFKYEANNIKRSQKVYVKGYPPIDLTVTESTIPDSIYSGYAGNFTYKVKNIGEARTISGAWADNIYLSTDTFIDASDKTIGETPIFMTLEKDSSYRRNISFPVPNGISGNYYVFFKTDWKRDNVDDDTTNNVRICRNPDGTPKKMKIILSASSDLKMAAWDVPSTATAGQPSTFSWKVENIGDTTTKAGNWTDGVYLSTDYNIDGSDIFLGSVTRTTNLKKGSYYNASETFFIPSNISGSYIVIIRTDNTNREYEHLAENNNIGASAMSVNIAPPGDLVVNSIYAPNSASAGSSVTVSYVIRNVGANPINGTRTDNIYLSEDTELDPSDVLFASKTESASIIPNGSRNMTETANIKGIKTGNYHFLVFTDVKNNISESKDTNNIGYSDLIDINVPELPLNVLTADTLFKNKELYYRFIIPDSLAGESILITLQGDSINGNNELYAKYENVPTRSDFEYGFSIPYYGNQEIMIPTAKKGTYYLMAYGKTSTSSKQNIKLLARKLNFEIRRVNPVVGGNTGQVTLKIEGAKFDSLTKFSLNNPSTEVIVKSIQIPDSTLFLYNEHSSGPKSIILINPTLAYVTFDLRNQPLGDYDVVATKEDGFKTTKLSKGFKIVTGSPPDIQVAVLSPSSTRANMLTSFNVMFSNEGNTDMVNGYLEVTSNGGAPISFTIDGLKYKTTSLQIPLEEFNGIKNLLRPRGAGTITVYTYSNTTLAFNIIINK